ncbi:serine/threonine-protein kinase [Streptomyces coeruleoprunus]|uniref:non-specific serine/threonine protein kinase n=1 Tax=Streptomyces coeruleoprunus TaxID=285563 RepID=A0ABV9X6T9_9ACTN
MNAWSVPGCTEVRELGSGASGRVVLAVHDVTGVRVAVKYLGDNLRADRSFLHGFRDEARLLGDLESPYVVRLYEYVEGPDGAAIVMELVEGVALRALLRQQGPLGPEAALTVLKGSLLGLAAAHGAGVVHRDYKPENVLVGTDGVSRLVDFGIAAGRGTSAGVSGTPAYMAPEQWTGEPASPSADVYAATATFYECLTGRKPFAGESVAELALRHVSDPVPEDGVPEPVLPLIRSGMAKSPGDRPQEAAAFVHALEAVATRAYGPRWEERGRGRLAALTALLPLLLPSAGDRAETTTDLASTSLGRDDGWWQAWKPNALGLGAISSALVLALVLVLGAVAEDTGTRGAAAGRALATTSFGPGEGGAAPGPATATPSAGPSASATASPGPTGSASPTATASPEPTDTATVSPSPYASPPATTAPPPTSPPPPTTPPTTTAPPPVVRPTVKSVTLTDFRQTGSTTATATLDVTTDGTGPLTLTVTWFSGGSGGGKQDGAAQTYERSGATHYTLTVDHTFQGAGCYWSVSATSDPAPANGGASRQLLTWRCDIR